MPLFPMECVVMTRNRLSRFAVIRFRRRPDLVAAAGRLRVVGGHGASRAGDRRRRRPRSSTCRSSGPRSARSKSALEISGTLAPRTRVGVKPKLPGTLERVLVDIGDRVSEGQVVATIDRREIDAQVDAADRRRRAWPRPALETAEAALANAVLEHERAKNLFERGALPRQRLDAAQTAHRAARGAARSRQGQPRAGRSRAAPRARSPARRDPHLADHRLRRRAQLRRRRHSRRPAGRRRRRPAAAEARSRRLGARSRPAEASACRRVVAVQAKPGETFDGRARGDRAGGRRAQPPLPDRGARRRTATATLLSGMYATARLVAVDRRRTRAACRAKPSPRATASASCSRSRATR